MFRKKIVKISVCCICTLLLPISTVIACEPEEEQPEPEESNDCDQPETNESSESSSFLDVLFERYPLLDKIIQLLLEFVYTWLANINFSLG